MKNILPILKRNFAFLFMLALMALAQSGMCAAAVPAEVDAAIDDVSLTFTTVFAVGVTIAVSLIGLRLLKRVAK